MDLGGMQLGHLYCNFRSPGMLMHVWPWNKGNSRRRWNFRCPFLSPDSTPSFSGNWHISFILCQNYFDPLRSINIHVYSIWCCSPRSLNIAPYTSHKDKEAGAWWCTWGYGEFVYLTLSIASRVLGTNMPCTQNPCRSLFSLYIVWHISCYVIKSGKLSTQTGI